MFKQLYIKLIAGKQKAVVAFIIAAVGTYVAKHGLAFPTNLHADLQALLVGALAHASVYFTGNK